LIAHLQDGSCRSNWRDGAHLVLIDSARRVSEM
jgi:hypothetical protein